MRKSFLSLFSAGARPSRHPGIPRQRIDATTENKGERLSCDSAGHGQGQRFSLPGLASGLCWSAGPSARFLFAGSVNVRCRAGRSGAAARRPRRALPSLLPGRLSSLSWARPPAGWGRARGPGAVHWQHAGQPDSADPSQVSSGGSVAGQLQCWWARPPAVGRPRRRRVARMRPPGLRLPALTTRMLSPATMAAAGHNCRI